VTGLSPRWVDDALAAASIAHLRAGQAPSGAFVASPTFSQYGFCWLRDGSFCALAMRAAGQPDSVVAFHRWVAGAVGTQRERMRAVTADLIAGRPVAGGRMPPTRYRLDGSAEPREGDWPNFQLDGYGTWLFALWSALSDGYSLSAEIEPVARAVADYLAATWRLPCYDYWEESPTRVHTSTLAALAAGLRAASRMFGEARYEAVADEIVTFTTRRCVHDGAFVKGADDTRVDGSLLSLAVPFGLVGLDSPVFVSTLARIRAELVAPGGGVWRYLGDSYYGGSPWVLLTAWLGWCDRLRGDTAGFDDALAWVRRAAGPDGALPEQVLDEPQYPGKVAEWQRRWGPVADPLLWSHAMYLLAVHGPEATRWN
jgi:GH15 family glucan-1,4-alpha-glucosidase